MKKVCRLMVSVILVLLVITSSIKDIHPASAKTAPITYKDSELARAVSLGIGTYQKNSTINYKTFFKMLDQVVSLANPKELSSWKKKFPNARKSSQNMNRDEGMLSIFFASRSMGNTYSTYNTIAGDTAIKKIGGKAFKEMSWNYSLLPGWNKTVTIVLDTTPADQWDNYMVGAYYYCMGRISITSDSILFDYDSKSNSMRLNQPLTYEKALLAAVRLYDSGLSETERIKTAEDTKFLKLIDTRRKEIRDTTTDIKVNGTSYFISNTGNDENDGLTPNTAWATIERANEIDTQPGDAILLERGCSFRGKLRLRNDIIYSAYGIGEKPIVMGSPESGADPSKWSLLRGTKNIWVFYKEIEETGAIVFNDGASCANRKTAFWNGAKYVDVIDKKTPIDIKSLKNLTFFHDVEYKGYSPKEVYVQMNIPGKIYLRCDAGNPGNVYQSIEFISRPYGYQDVPSSFILQVGQNCIIDNINFMYGQEGISISGNSTVQNCEVSWIGGNVTGYYAGTLGADITAVIRAGNGILVAKGSDNSVTNNYVHHTYDYGISTETGAWFKDPKDRYSYHTTFKGNLIEKCSGGFGVGDWEALMANRDDRIIFKDITIEDNYSIYSGYGWSHQTLDYDWGYASNVNNGNANLQLAFPPKAAQNIVIKNNVFYLGKYTLVEACHGGDGLKQLYNVTFSGNTYVQNPLGILIYWQSKTDYKYSQPFTNNLNAVKTIKDVLGDKNGVVWQ